MGKSKNRFSSDTVLVTASHAARFAIGLRKIADEFDRLALKLKEFQNGGVDSGGLKSALTGLVQVSRFCGSIQEAYCESAALEHAKEITGAALELERLIERIVVDAQKDEGNALARKQATSDEIELAKRPPPKKSKQPKVEK